MNLKLIKEQEAAVEEYRKKFQFMVDYKPSVGGQLKEETEKKFRHVSYVPPKKGTPKNKLSEIKGDDKTVFTHSVLQKMRSGKFDEKHLIFEAMPNVKDILRLDEAFQSFSEFMQALKTDEMSLKSPSNAIRMVFQDFVNGKQQEWYLIDHEEYHRALKLYSYRNPQSETYDSYWAPKVIQWVENAKVNIQQFAANSYLCSGPTLEQDSENSEGQNLMALMWYHLTGDESIPYRPYECTGTSDEERAFFKKYWSPFTKYIETKYGEDVETYETDSQMDGFFNIVAEFDKNKGDFKLWLATLNKLIDLCHNRGTLAHLFIRGGNASCEQISNA